MGGVHGFAAGAGSSHNCLIPCGAEHCCNKIADACIVFHEKNFVFVLLHHLRIRSEPENRTPCPFLHICTYYTIHLQKKTVDKTKNFGDYTLIHFTDGIIMEKKQESWRMQ